MKRFLWLGLVLFVYMICTGCGDTFRPIIIPNPPVFPNPQATNAVLSLNANSQCLDNACDNGIVPLAGTAMSVDVSGDSVSSITNLGTAPVYAVQQSATHILVVNQAVTGLPNPPSGCSVMIGTQIYNVCPSLTELTFSGASISSTTTISLPVGSAPNFAAVAPSASTAYVTFPTLNEIAVINTTAGNQTATIPVGSNPYALAVTPNNTKLYVANKGDSTIDAFNTVDLSPRTVSPTNTSSPPIWMVARTDSQRVYVLEQSGILASIDTTSTAGPDPLTEYPTISVPGATTMTYDSNLNRLYIPGGSEMEMVDVSGTQPVPIATIIIPPFSLLGSSSVSAIAASVAALPDGSKAYVGSYPSSAGNLLPSQFTISSVSGDGTTATYAYTLTSGYNLTPGVTVTVAGTGLDGTFVVSAIVTGTSTCPATCFQAANTTATSGTQSVSGSGSGSNIFPQVTVVDLVANSIKLTTGVAGFAPLQSPFNTFCANTPFRFMMAAGGDSTRAYLSSCDGGNVNIIDTSSDTYIANLPAPISSRSPVQGNPLNPPQNPVFLMAGP
jgi:hypothetical protein